MKPTEEKTRSNPSDLPVYLFKQGNNCEAYRYFGAHIEQRAGETGVVFRVWAPHATAISVVGDFNSWKPGSHPMRKVDNDSVWELFIPGMKEYDVYKYCVTTRAGDLVYKADPYAFHAETRPSNGSKVYDLNGFVWHDEAWQNAQKKADVINGPMNIYEMHAGSWKQKEGGLPYNYSELADELLAVSHRPYGTGFYYGDARQSPDVDGYTAECRHAATVEACEPAGEGAFRVIARCYNRFCEGDELEALSPGPHVPRVRVRNLAWLPEPDGDDAQPKRVPVAVANRSAERYAFETGEELAPGDFLRMRINVER